MKTLTFSFFTEADLAIAVKEIAKIKQEKVFVHQGSQKLFIKNFQDLHPDKNILDIVYYI